MIEILGLAAIVAAFLVPMFFLYLALLAEGER